MRAAALILEDESSGTADGVEALSDDPESVLDTHMRKQGVVDERKVGVEQVKGAVNHWEQLLDVLVVEEWQAVKIPTVDLALLLEPRL